MPIQMIESLIQQQETLQDKLFFNHDHCTVHWKREKHGIRDVFSPFKDFLPTVIWIIQVIKAAATVILRASVVLIAITDHITDTNLSNSSEQTTARHVHELLLPVIYASSSKYLICFFHLLTPQTSEDLHQPSSYQIFEKRTFFALVFSLLLLNFSALFDNVNASISAFHLSSAHPNLQPQSPRHPPQRT